MNWEKAGPACTEAQAVALVDELIGGVGLFGVDKPEVRIAQFVKKLQEWPHSYAVKAVDAYLETGKRFPVWSDLFDVMNVLGARDNVVGEGLDVRK